MTLASSASVRDELTTTPPAAYLPGYEQARAHDQAAADNYLKHTTIGDPELDPIMEELSAELSPGDLHRFVAAGIEQNGEVLRIAPRSLRDFFRNLQEPPWLYYEYFGPGVRAFHANVDLMLAAFVTGVLVEGFSTLIAKSFRITGRVATTTRRLQQNNRHMMEIFFPAGLQRNGEGWKLSTRIRFVHTRIRGLLANSEDWNHEAWGTPISAAHLGFSISVFSKRLLDYSKMLGARFSREEEQSVLAIWRYAGHLMGIPETILYKTGAEADKTCRIGYLCEPPPDTDSVAVANLLIQAIPTVANVQDPAEHKKLVGLAYRLSRALIGSRLADSFDFPQDRKLATLFKYRMRQRFLRLMRSNQRVRADNFTQLLQISVYDDEGLSYKMPDHVHNSKSSPW